MVENIPSMAINTAGSLLNQAAVGIVILIAGLALGLLIKKVSYRIFQEITLNKMASDVGFSYNVEYWISSLLSYAVYLFTIILFLDQLGIRSIVIYLTIAGIIVLLLLTFIVGLKDIIPNFMGWMYIRRTKTVQEKKVLELPQVSGMVQHIGYLETKIKTKNGDVLHVPNSLFLKNQDKQK